MSSFTIRQQLATLAPRDQATLTLIEALGQQHLVEHWPEPGQSTHDKQRLLAQIRELDARYPGGLERYLNHATELLAQARRGDTPYRDYAPHVPEGLGLNFYSAEFRDAEELGLKEANRCGFVMVAGGLGERLGFSGIKLELPAETATGRSFLGLYAAHILAFQRSSNQRLGEDRKLPLAIMTSDDTHTATEGLLRKNKNFGLATDQVVLLKQEKVASLSDPTPRLAINPLDPYELMTKPHGHGDVHALIHQTGLARRWLDQGVRWLLFFQDTNALALHVFLAALGTSIREGLDVNSVVIPRYPGEAIGALVRLAKPDSELTVNVEYNQLDALLRHSPDGLGDVADHSGHSPYPGNANIFVSALAPYTKTLEMTGGVVPEFVNPKYVDESRTSFKTPTRLECMMQDYLQLVPGERVGFTQFERSVCFSPVKNSPTVAASRQAQQPPVPAEGAATGEADLYALHRRILRLAGANIEPGFAASYCGIEVVLFPIVVLSPELTTPSMRLSDKLAEVRISSRSTLVVNADSIEIRGLDLDGSLEIRAVRGARIVLQNLIVQNRGWAAREPDLAGTIAPELAIRGFCIERFETLLIQANEPGDYLVNPQRLADFVMDPALPGYHVVSL